MMKNKEKKEKGPRLDEMKGKSDDSGPTVEFYHPSLYILFNGLMVG